MKKKYNGMIKEFYEDTLSKYAKAKHKLLVVYIDKVTSVMSTIGEKDLHIANVCVSFKNSKKIETFSLDLDEITNCIQIQIAIDECFKTLMRREYDEPYDKENV